MMNSAPFSRKVPYKERAVHFLLPEAKNRTEQKESTQGRNIDSLVRNSQYLPYP